MSLRDAVATVIEKHNRREIDLQLGGCPCGDDDWDDHEIHLADAILRDEEVWEALELSAFDLLWEGERPGDWREMEFEVFGTASEHVSAVIGEVEPKP